MDDESRCGCCPKGVPALWHVHGYAEDGMDGNFVYTPVCDEHKREFGQWDGEPYFHGYVYITAIHPIIESCPVTD
jgi:hypothetical protein